MQKNFHRIKQLIRTVFHRIVAPRIWRYFIEKKLSRLSDKSFIRLSGAATPGEFLAQFHDRARLCFFFHPRNRKDFFLQMLTQTQPLENILADADDVLRNRFQTLGSEKVELGAAINWHKDFISGREWPPYKLSLGEILDLDHLSDIKVPWELSRFHQVWWLGKAYWLTGNEEYAKKFGALAEDWLDQNPLGKGANWAVTMEVAIRACNWIVGYYFFCTSPSLSDAFWLRFLKSLYCHGRFIDFHREYSRRTSNHYLSNVAAAIFLGIFFRDASFGKRWLAWGIREMENEMKRQVLPDGVDYEKSVSYHRLVLELFYAPALLCRANRIALPEPFLKRLEKMFEFVLHYSRPDGSVPLVGDADDGRLFRLTMDQNLNDHRHALLTGGLMFERRDFVSAAGQFDQEALWYFGGEGFELFQRLRGDSPQLHSMSFRDSGFFVLRGSESHVFVDAGELGMRGRGGHGQNDTLSFECWVDGSPLVVDSGTFTYTGDPTQRNAFRSTRAHNTIMIDGKELAEFESLWSVKEDLTTPKILTWSVSDEKDVLEAEHHAYQDLLSPVIHSRRFELLKDPFVLVIIDTLRGTGSHSIESFLHFHPGASVSLEGPLKAVASIENRAYIVQSSQGVMTLHESWYSRSYGIKEKNTALRLAMDAPLPISLEMTLRRHP